MSCFGPGELRTRDDFRRGLLHLLSPFADASGFAARLDGSAYPQAHYGARVARLEMLSRLLWGLAPLAAGGGSFPAWEQVRAEIVRGTDPGDSGFWGWPGERDQRIVESAALGFGLALAPDELWTPLLPAERTRFAAWLRAAAAAKPVDNNWVLFATLVTCGLRRVGEPVDEGIVDGAFARIDDFHQGGGWFSDGIEGAFDHYGPWAIHYYSLINLALGGLGAAASGKVRERAQAFAPEYLHWFADDGAGLAFGRSLTYRFAQAGFAGALAFAGVKALPWGVLRGVWARHLRWWNEQPVLDGSGALSIGYGYPSLLMSESYNAPGSPYWALKAFVPLALPADHPFWTSDEEPMPDLPRVHAQPGFLLQRNGDQVTALSATPIAGWVRNGDAKYGKFAYSTAFGFAVPTRATSLEGAAADSALALSDDGLHWRVRESNESWSVDDSSVRARWKPWPDVLVDTWLVPSGRWHIRAHRIVTSRTLHTAEGGFCVPVEASSSSGEGFASASADLLSSGIRDLTGARQGAVIRPDPNGHLLWPRTLLPVLRGTLDPGEHLLVTGVFGSTDGDVSEFAAAPSLPVRRPLALLAMSSATASYGLAGIEALAEIAEFDPDLIADDFSRPDVATALNEAEVLVTHWGCAPIDEAVLAAAPRLRAVVHIAGSVKEFVTDACWERGLAVSSAAAANALPVAEYTLAAILFANKRILAIRDDHREHRGRPLDWHARYPDAGNYRRRIGIVGASRIGRRVLELLRPFDFEVLLHDPYLTEGEARALGARRLELDELCSLSDVVSLHAPQTPETRHLLDRRRLALMRDGTTVINTARGPLVDGEALVDELRTGRINAVIDVTDPWVLPADSALFELPNVLLTPHIAGSVGNEMRRLVDAAVAEVARYASGFGFAHPVRREDLAHGA